MAIGRNRPRATAFGRKWTLPRLSFLEWPLVMEVRWTRNDVSLTAPAIVNDPIGGLAIKTSRICGKRWTGTGARLLVWLKSLTCRVAVVRLLGLVFHNGHSPISWCNCYE